MAKKLDTIKLTKMLSLWGTLPNPDYAFFSKHRMSFHTSLKDLTYTPELQSALLARESAVMGDPWELVCDNDSTVDFIKENLDSIGANKIFRNIFHAMWYGYTVLEHPMEKVNGKWVYTKIDSLPSDWFAFTGQGDLIPSNHTDTSPMNMVIGDIEKEVELVQYRATFGNPYGESILARLFWYATYIRGGLDMWVSYLDRFGDDSIIGRQLTDNEEKKQEFLQALLEFKSSGALVVDGDYTVEVVKTDKAGSSSLFKDFHILCSQEIAKLILGHASALEGQAGKLGNDESLGIVRQDITQDDKSLIAETMTRLIKHLCLVNGIKDNVTFIFTPEKEDENQRIERDKKLVEMGYDLSEEYVRKTYRFGDDELVKTMSSPPTRNLSEREERWISQMIDILPLALKTQKNFSEGNEDGKKSDDFYKTIDSLIEDLKGNNIYKKLVDKTLKEVEKKEYWEDAVAEVLQVGNSFNVSSDDLALKLLNAYAIGQVQIANKIESLQNANFSTSEDVVFSTFDEAKEFLTAKVSLPAKHFETLSTEMQKYAFTVGSIFREDVVVDISSKLLEAFDNGDSFYKFKKSLREGEFREELQDVIDKRLELVYTQNMNNAYSYGRYQGLMQAVEIFPNWEYVTVGDNRVRDSHKAINGTVKRYDDPFWKTHYPPNGFRCRCVVEISTEEPNTKDVGKGVAVSEGFDHNVGEMNGWVKARITQMNTVLSRIPTRTSFFKNETPLRDWDNNKKVITAGRDYSQLENGLELAKERLSQDIGTLGLIYDKNGNTVGSNFDYILDHISTSERNGRRVFDQEKWNTRSVLVDRIKDIITTGDIVEDIERYNSSQQIIVARKYIKNVKLNGENTPVMIIAEYPKNERDTMPILTTIYPVRSADERTTRTGILLK